MMRRLLLSLLCLCFALQLSAQFDYKELLRTLPEMSDRQALYALQRFQAFYPRKPHPCFLLANLNYKLQAEEHALANYYEKENMLYLAQVFYGNCSVLLANDDIKQTMYPVEQLRDNFSEPALRAWLLMRAEEVKQERERCSRLYEAYSAMVNDYDSCLQVFTALTGRYTRQKELILVLDSLDAARLNLLENLSARLPEDIRTFYAALEQYPIEGYAPEIRFRPVSFYRLEGLTSTDFLRSEVLLWDFAAWTRDMRTQLAEMERIRTLMATEQERLAARRPGPENTWLLNTIRRYDPNSAIASLMHVEWLATQAHALEQRILRDSVAEEDYLSLLQLTYRLDLLVQEVDRHRSLTVALRAPQIPWRYAEFVQTYLSEHPLSDYYTLCAEEVHDVQTRVTQYILALPGLPETTQISETMQALVSDGTIEFVPL